MTIQIAIRRWLPVCLFLLLMDSPAGQAQQAPSLTKRVERKLPVLLASEPIKEEPGDDELRKLLKARYNLVLAEIQKMYQAWRMGLGSFDEVAEFADQLVQSRLELTDKPTERVVFLRQFVELMRDAEAMVRAQYQQGMTSSHQVYRVRYQVLDAEILLLRAQQEVDNAGDKQSVE